MYRRSYAFLALMLAVVMTLSACYSGTNLEGSILPGDIDLESTQPEDTAHPQLDENSGDFKDSVEQEDPEDLDGGDVVLLPNLPQDKLPEESTEPEASSEPEQTSDPTSSPAPAPTKKPSPKYMLEVDVTNQVVTAFTQDSKGDYSNVVRRMICSTGRSSTPTPLGTYKMPGGRYDRVRWGYFTKFNTWAQYWSRVYRGYLFHSILYDKQDESTMRQSTVNALGSKASHGCIRLTVQDAKWIYINAKPGTTVKVVQKKKDSEYTKRVRAASLGVALPISMRVAAAEKTLDKIQLKAGESLQIQGLVTYTDDKEKDEAKNIKWTFNNQGIAQISGNTLQAVAPGKAVLTAKFKDVSAKVEIEILEPDPIDQPLPDPSDDPSPDPSDEPLPDPSDDPSPDPSDDPSPDPSDEPSPDPSDDPSPDPSDDPSPDPSDEPSPDPSDEPSPDPSPDPTPTPTPSPTPTPDDDTDTGDDTN